MKTFEINEEERTCFPSGLKTNCFVDITTIGDFWKTYLDTETGEKHSCYEYHKEYLEEVMK